MQAKPQPRYKKGDRIGGRYLVHDVKMGGMGEVYLCLDLETNYPYALKTFQQPYLTDTQRLRRAFEHEVAIWIALEKHPNIVRCFAMLPLDNQPFMVLEWVSGEEGRGTDLRSWLRRGPLNLKLALEITVDICNGLIHAQARLPGLVHRDLKPGNILMAQGGLAKITDLGLAQIVKAAGLEIDQEGVASRRYNLVSKQGIAGTPAYMAPEQRQGEALDERTDIYALGCILYEMLTGRLPSAVDITQATPQQLAQRMNTHTSNPFHKLSDELTPGLDDLVQRCLAKAPSARPSSISELVRQLTQFYQRQFGQPLPSRPKPGEFGALDYNDRGVTYLNLGHNTQALADFDQAIHLDPCLAIAYVNRGSMFHNEGQFYYAIRDYDKSISLDPNRASAYNNRGISYRKLNQFERAIQDYNEAIRLDFTLADAYNNRGSAFNALSQFQLAIPDFVNAIQLNNRQLANSYDGLGIAYKELGQFDQAIEAFDKAISLSQDNARTYNNRGAAHGARGDYENAVKDYSKAIHMSPLYAMAYANRAIAYSALRMNKEAQSDYDYAILLGFDSTRLSIAMRKKQAG